MISSTPTVVDASTGAVEWSDPGLTLFRFGVPLLAILVLVLTAVSAYALWKWRVSGSPEYRAKGLAGLVFLLLETGIVGWLGFSIADGMIVSGLR